MADAVINKPRSRWLRYKHKDTKLTMIQKSFQNVLGQLSLFTHADIDHLKSRDIFQDMRSEPSISEDARNIPTSLSEFCQQLRNRITRHSITSTCFEDQEALLMVMMSELSLIWQDLCGFPSDPPLTPERNKQLHGKVLVEVLGACELLYLHHLHLLGTLKRRDVFSCQANHSRVAAHMAKDISSLLNLHSIRRSVAMRPSGSHSALELRDGQRETPPTQPAHGPSTLGICYSKPVSRKCRQRNRTMDIDLAEMEEKLGRLHLECIHSDQEPTTCQRETCCTVHRQTTHTRGSMWRVFVSQRSLYFSFSLSGDFGGVPPNEEEDHHLFQNHFTRLKGCCSMPDLQRETMLEELELTKLPPRPQSPLVFLSTHCYSVTELEILDPTEDLKRLLQDTYPDDKLTSTDSETDLPPLLRASICRGSSRHRELTLMLQKLEEEEQRKSPVEAVRQQSSPADVVNVKVSSQGIARTAPARVCDRAFPLTISMNMCLPVYSHLLGEIEPSSVKWLDRNLFIGAEIKDVFKELSKELPKYYLHLDEEDPLIEPAISSAEQIHSLKNRNHGKKRMNPSMPRPHPCGIFHSKRMESVAHYKRPADVTSRAYAAWHKWWKSELALNDYLSYISDQESEYLSVLFHLYDSDDSTEEEERKTIQLQKASKRRRQEKINALKQQKQAFVPGLWNVNTVLMGGLGKEPILDGEVLTNKKTLQMEAVQDYSVSTVQCMEGDLVQNRLEKIWTMLYLSEAQRLDMAIKYSSHTHKDKLEEAIAAWEEAAQLIQQREKLLSEVEQLERAASDPNRFFLKGLHGSSTARLVEASQREKLHVQIAALDKALSKSIHHISVTFNDTVTYMGRPYGEKMRWDHTEMLYWLQQERRVDALEKLVRGRASLSDKLPSLNTSSKALSRQEARHEGTLTNNDERNIKSQESNSKELFIPGRGSQVERKY